MADLQAFMARTTKSIYRSLGSICVMATYEQQLAGAYAVASGDFAFGSVNSVANIPAILTRYGAQELLPDLVLHTDWKARIQQADLPIVPRERDTLLLQGAHWLIVAIMQDTARATWMLSIRRPGP